MSKKQTAREAAIVLAARRKVRKLECEVCGEPFKAVDNKALYCSNACKVRAYRERRDGLRAAR